jgi:hypothetical protein
MRAKECNGRGMDRGESFRLVLDDYFVTPPEHVHM